MKIVINTSHQRFGGAIQVALSFIHECRHFPEHEYHVWVGPGVRKSLKEEDFPANFHFTHFDFGVITFRKTFMINSTLQKVEKRIQPDVIIATSGPSYFHSRAPQIIGFNLPLYIYPESPYVQQWRGYRKLRMTLKKWLHFHYFKRDATAYVVQTDDVNQRIRKALGTEKVYTVTNTCSSWYDAPAYFPPKLPEKSNGVFRFLTLTAYYPHKNLELIPEVLAELKNMGITRVEFVLTLQAGDFERHIGSHPRIFNVGPVKPEEAPSLYLECDGMFLPTLAECFSASYPEAMKMQKPIVTTDLGFARSICGNAALYFEPMNVKSAVQQIKEMISHPALQETLKAHGNKVLEKFDTPRARAEKYLQLCIKVALNEPQRNAKAHNGESSRP